MSDTPRTDRAFIGSHLWSGFIHDFCREIERELAEKERELAALQEESRQWDKTSLVAILARAEKAERELAEKEAALAGLLNAEHCQYCQNQGWYADVESNRNTGEAEQVQVECEWCYTTKNSFFNVRASLPESAKHDGK